ncbi:MAG TPA: hypothetical protein DEG76_13590 [Pseudohongiella sp.]|mgnify:CR=1 FL=1|nr:hypothetical protein [Pseudohongiella sp.]|tara:strand:- start:4412 stop:7057 length:2646 start_codon:yes stop_codon:yes gene_type:complete
MKNHVRATTAIIKKDLIGLAPLIAIAFVAFFAVPLIASLDLENIGGDAGFWVFLQNNIYWLGFFLSMILVISAFQQDPADSLNHDWLVRPIPRSVWLSAKLLFLLLVIVLPVIASRFLINLSSGMPAGLALNFALGVASFEAVLLVPLTFMLALLAPSTRKFIALLVGVFLVFLLPGWSATRPILEFLGVGLGGDFNSLMWLQAAIAFFAGVLGACAIYWFQYCRRQRRAAYAAFWSAVLVMFLSTYPPSGLYNWDQALAAHAALINDSTDENRALEEQVLIRPAMACYPAVYHDGVSGESASSGENSALLTEAAWPTSQLAAAGPGAMTFASTIAYRELLTEWFLPAGSTREHSVEWMLSQTHVSAQLSSNSLPEPVELPQSWTSANRLEPYSAVSTNLWLVPGAVLDAVAQDPSTELQITVDATLLKPSAYELPLDGEFHAFPELGSCRALPDTTANNVKVECFKRGTQPELVAAQLIGIDSSRVDSARQPVFTHDLLEFFRNKRYELTLESPTLVDDDSIMVTAYHAERALQKQIVTPGILGDSTAICPLPDVSGEHDGIYQASTWSDTSPHEVSLVTVARGVRLEVLDWRQTVRPELPTLILLPGLGATAHSYDAIAPKLAEHYNVVGITRRGVGDSSKPDRGYEISQLAADVVAVMDTLSLPQAVMVGHSFGGEELSYLGAHHPERVQGLIYLDAAYDRVTVNSGEEYRRNRQLDRLLPSAPPIRPSEATSYQAMKSYQQRIGRTRQIPEGEIIASYDLSTGNIKHSPLYLDALMQGLVRPEYEKITAPALSLYAVPSSAEAMMETWYDRHDPELQQTVQQIFELRRARQMAEVERFESEVRNGRAVVIEDANHWIFLSHEAEVLAEIDAFVAGLE